MKIASLQGRSTLVSGTGLIDIESASGGEFPVQTDALIPALDELQAWLEADKPAATDPRIAADFLAEPSLLDAPLTRPRQVFALGLNYRSHANEVAMDLPKSPMIFTKFVSSLAGPGANIRLPGKSVDWEVELVAVIGQGGRDIPEHESLSRICAYCVGQDVTERNCQFENSPAQFGMAKSFANFSPIGPWLTTADELGDPQDLAIACHLDGETVQEARTSMMLFDLKTQVAYLSSICELYPGDIIFTGTPAGIGFSRNPQRFIQPGETLTSHIEQLGTLRNTFT
ncbi:MAG: fumarylacetoacetate hydrolase family protein [Pseudomonadota bacterium]